MSLIITKPKFTPHPEGVVQAVCVDAIDLGLVDGDYGKKPMFSLVFETAAVRDDGTPWFVSRRYGASLGKKSAFRKDLKGWRGRDATPEELRSFNIDVLKGKACSLMIQHNENEEGQVFGNIVLVSKPDATNPYRASGLYVRRPQQGSAQPQGSQLDAGEPVDED